MNRVHLFELEDQPWFPRILRDAGTAYLEFAGRTAGHAAALAPKVEQALARSGEKRIVDLCSGGAGPVAEVVDVLGARGVDVHALLTDFYPNEGSMARAAERSAGRIDWSREPVDATNVPRGLSGLRTIFNAFHHFRPAMARGIIVDAANAKQPIAIFEVVSRNLLPLLAILLAPLTFALALPLLRPFRWQWIPFTYLVPILPLFVMWDGLVSCFRVYSPRELEEMVRSLEPRHREAYDWEVGYVRLPGAPVYATYLLGIPLAAQSPS